MGRLLISKLGNLVAIGVARGWLDGNTAMDRFSEGMEDGYKDTLGKLDGADEGSPVLALAGPTLG